MAAHLAGDCGGCDPGDPFLPKRQRVLAHLENRAKLTPPHAIPVADINANKSRFICSSPKDRQILESCKNRGDGRPPRIAGLRLR
jgi:hypothetical protein